ENEYLKEQEEKGFIEMHLGEEAKEELTSKTVYDLVIKSPGISLNAMNKPYKDDEITSQTNIFLSLYASQCVGITGTKGKSTTSTLIYNMIKAKHEDTLFAGNIGRPMFDLIDRITPDTIIVLELSAHQLQYINQSPKVSVLLNLYEEHLDHFITYEEYQKAKLNILKYQNSKENAFIYNEDSKLISSWIKKIKPKSTLLPINAKNYPFDEPKYLKGEHNKFNIMVAYEVAKFLGVESEEGLKEVLEFKGLEHRLEFVCLKDGVEYYNDSISTIAQTTIAALNSLEGVQTLILGGKDRGVDYSELANILIDYKDLK
ncbi:MAG TPA: UDP-N-acetylmuramoyl-L-alanine--D-glutamate ligase, partial [Bacteroidales bacterium]|nr:UDP-N-acetylmuramoyl-L-alanine--D-glutamate ligase [Bacteroidales bacterium]